MQSKRVIQPHCVLGKGMPGNHRAQRIRLPHFLDPHNDQYLKTLWHMLREAPCGYKGEAKAAHSPILLTLLRNLWSVAQVTHFSFINMFFPPISQHSVILFPRTL